MVVYKEVFGEIGCKLCGGNTDIWPVNEDYEIHDCPECCNQYLLETFKINAQAHT